MCKYNINNQTLYNRYKNTFFKFASSMCVWKLLMSSEKVFAITYGAMNKYINKINFTKISFMAYVIGFTVDFTKYWKNVSKIGKIIYLKHVKEVISDLYRG